MMSHHNKLFETAEIGFRELILYTTYLLCQLPDNIFIDTRRQETGEIHVHSCHRDIHVLVPNFETVCVFGIVTIPTQLVVIPFLKVPSSVIAHAHGTDSLA